MRKKIRHVNLNISDNFERMSETKKNGILENLEKFKPHADTPSDLMRRHNLTQYDQVVPEYAVVQCGNLTQFNLTQSDQALSNAQVDEQTHGLTYQPNQT
jgi:S-ribosylhomocysteine lyase LuxS involved in autoinducer biosynthesis